MPSTKMFEYKLIDYNAVIFRMSRMWSDLLVILAKSNKP